MNSALVFLASRSAWNAVLVRLRRLRQPKYLIGLLVGFGYFYWIFTGPVMRGSRPPRTRPPVALEAIPPEVWLGLAALALLVFALVSAWIIPGSREVLGFTEAEVAFLLPGPVSRGTLIRYKLFRAQLGLLFLAVFMTLVSGRFARDGSALIHAAGWWVVLSTLQLHRLGASFLLSRLYDRGLSSVWLRWGAVLVLLGVAALLVGWRMAAPAAPQLDPQFLQRGGLLYLHEIASSGPGPWLLAPFRWVVAPSFAVDAIAFLRALPPALGIMALHYWWVTRADVSFEEAAIAHAERLAKIAEARKAGHAQVPVAPTKARVPLFNLSPRGVAAVALVWKFLLQSGGRRAFRIWAAVLGGVLLLAAAAGRIPSARGLVVGITIVALVGLVLSVVLLPLVTGRSLHLEMVTGDAAKAWPLPGWQLALGQLLGPALAGTALQIMLLALAAAANLRTPVPLADAWVFLVAAPLVLPLLNLLLSLVPTSAPLLFPGWFRPGEQAGVEATGVRIITFLGQTLFGGLALVPVVLIGLGVKLGAGFLVPGALSSALALAAALGLLAVEVLGGIVALGRILEGFDPSER